ncbi:hypothetical protein DXG03_006799 [Asterophora parasitica]|uniref:Zn(2)-C6 fungal-type domain-containing protein n=1 Tax=Asterophora parasitica TaxID=117018 RepID=A0A9P7G7A2_9AGAR|nr:hypothetical protein DXG03_006799 [Asterophora parasitica]
MDDHSPAQPQQQQPAASNAAPQIRSRITVVCAECKRLKLKCDRRTPCGSCTKRDTVSRCIYSPAAAEKVDLHSLNNRLIHVEAILAMVTSGKTPPPFQSSYPLAQVALPSTHTWSSLKPRGLGSHHLTSTSLPDAGASISIRFNDLVNIWLTHCQLDIFPTTSATRMALKTEDGDAYIKLEPSPVETLQLSSPYEKTNTIIIDEGPSSPVTSHSAPQHPHSPSLSLPPLHIYYSAPQQQEPHHQYAYATQNPYPSAEYSPFPPNFQPAPSAPQPLHSTSPKPAATPALLSHLPHPRTRSRLLAAARKAHPHLPLLVHWGRLTDLADPEAVLVRDKQKKLAHAVFFGVRAGSPSPVPAATTVSSNIPHVVNLPLFVCLCYVLALGAFEEQTLQSREEEEEEKVNYAFLYALAGQAMCVWEEYRTSSEAQAEDVQEESREADGASGGEGKRVKTSAAKEKEEMNGVVAGLLQVKYLLRSGAPDINKKSEGLEMAFQLIGKLVNFARAVGLARDPEEENWSTQGSGQGSRKGTKADQRRRMIWWDLMFYDAFLSDALHHAPLIASYSYTTKMPAIAHNSTVSNPVRKYRSVEDGHESSGEPVDVDASPSSSQKPNGTGMPKGRTPSQSVPPRPNGKGRVGGSAAAPLLDDAEHGYFGVRCQCVFTFPLHTFQPSIFTDWYHRLTLLVQTVKHRQSHPGCECCSCGTGYSLDQAAKLEVEVRAWAADLPAALSLAPAYSSTSGDSNFDSKCDPSPPTTTQAYLAAELAVVANRLIIAAYLPLMRPSPSSTTASSSSAYSVTHPWSPASRATVDAAQCMVRAGQALRCFSSSDRSQGLLGDYYSLEKAMVDALVICAHSAFVTGKPGRPVPVMEEVTVALEVLSSMGTQGRGGDLGRTVASVKRRVDLVLQGCELVSGRKRDDNALKRKHHVLEGGTGQGRGDNELDLACGDMVEGGDENNLPIPPQQHQQRPVQLPPSPPRSGFGSGPRVLKASEKKNAKKTYQAAYPVIGVRDRGKEAPPWMAKRASLTPLTLDSPHGKNTEPRSNDLTGTPTIENTMPFLSPSTVQRMPPSQPVTLDIGYRPRSSCITQTPRTHAAEYSMPFGTPGERELEVHASQRRRFSIHDNGAHQPQQDQAQMQQQQAFTMSPINLYNPEPGHPSQEPSQAGSLDAHPVPRGFEQTPHGPFDTNPQGVEVFRGAPSPYPNSHTSISTASSPYESTPVHPHTPTFGIAQKPNPPVFGAQATVSASPQSYIHISMGYDAGYNGHLAPHQQQQQVLGSMAMDTSMSVQQHAEADDAMGAPPSIPAYEKHQPSLYIKPSLDLAQQQEALHHYQVASGRSTPVDVPHHMPMNAPTQAAWPPNSQYMQTQPLAEQQPVAPYWTTDAYYR